MPDPSSESLVSPAPIIRIAGSDEPAVAEAVTDLEIREEIGAPATLELGLVDWGDTGGGTFGFLWSDREVIDLGRRVEVSASADGDAPVLFAGRVVGLRGRYREATAPQLVVLAADVLWELDAERRTRTFEELTDVEAATLVVEERGLVLDVELTTTTATRDVIAQLGRTDLEFLRERGERLGADLLVRDGHVVLRDPEHGPDEPLGLTFGEGLESFTPELNLSEQVTSVDVVGWDPATKQEIRASASPGPPDGSGALESGPHALQATFGARHGVRAGAEPASEEVAAHRARIELAARARRFVTGVAACRREGLVRAGGRVRIRGVGPLFDGAYRIVALRHTFDRTEGWRTDLRVERADPGFRRPGAKGPDDPKKKPDGHRPPLGHERPKKE